MYVPDTLLIISRFPHGRIRLLLDKVSKLIQIAHCRLRKCPVMERHMHSPLAYIEIARAIIVLVLVDVMY